MIDDLIISLLYLSLDLHTTQYLTRGYYEPLRVTVLALPPRRSRSPALPPPVRSSSLCYPQVVLAYCPPPPVISHLIAPIIDRPNPRCRTSRFISRGEQICRLTMEAMYGVPFPTARPSWLVSSDTKVPMELDCYNEQLRLAVEYNGLQHYQYHPQFHPTYQDYWRLIHRDREKRDRCREQGVLLIVVPYEVRHCDIPSYLKERIRETYSL